MVQIHWTAILSSWFSNPEQSKESLDEEISKVILCWLTHTLPSRPHFSNQVNDNSNIQTPAVQSSHWMLQPGLVILFVGHHGIYFMYGCGEGPQTNFLWVGYKLRAWLSPRVWSIKVFICINQQVKWAWNIKCQDVFHLYNDDKALWVEAYFFICSLESGGLSDLLWPLQFPRQLWHTWTKLWSAILNMNQINILTSIFKFQDTNLRHDLLK